MVRRFTYASTGVDRDLRQESKKELQVLKDTYRFSRYGGVLRLPYGNIFPFHGRYLDLTVEGVGTKVLVAQLAGKYDTIGIDGVAMAVNDVIRSGATPLAIADNIHAQVSDPKLIKEWMKGISRGASESECIVPSGEIGDVADLIKGLRPNKGFDMVFAAVGEVQEERVISGREVKPGDPIIGVRSSGLHSNGISLVRRVLFKEWGGMYDPDVILDGLDRELILEALEPTEIYVKSFLRLAGRVRIKAATHITGDSYLKFGKIAELSSGIGFEFNNFKPQPIFGIVQETARRLHRPIADAELFKTFNMGWGFAVVVDRQDKEEALGLLNRVKGEAEQIGKITTARGTRIFFKGKKILLD